MKVTTQRRESLNWTFLLPGVKPGHSLELKLTSHTLGDPNSWAVVREVGLDSFVKQPKCKSNAERCASQQSYPGQCFHFKFSAAKF